MKEPKLRFKEFKDEWQQVNMGELFDVVTDYVSNGSFESLRHNVKSYNDENYAYMIRLQDASNGWKGPWLYTDEHGYEFLSKSKLFENDIIMSNVGSVGKFFKVPKMDKPMTLAPNAVLLRSNKNSNEFLYWLLQTESSKNKVISFSTPGVQHKINKTDFKTIETFVPSVEEQQKIGSFFDELDDQIKLQLEKLETLKQDKKGYLQKMFPSDDSNRPKLRLKGFSDDWKGTTMGETFDVVTDYVSNGSFKSLRENVQSYNDENYAYMIRLQDASNGWEGPWLYTDEHGYEFLSKSKLFENDIIMSNVGSVGKFFKVPKMDKPMTLAPNAVLLRSKSNSNEFLYWLLQTENTRNKVIGFSTPGVQRKINKTDFKSISLLIPSLKEQQMIGKFFDNLDKQIKLQRQKVTDLQNQKKAYLQKMFI